MGYRRVHTDERNEIGTFHLGFYENFSEALLSSVQFIFLKHTLVHWMSFIGLFHQIPIDGFSSDRKKVH